ncbi:GPI transamidase component PIG-T [Cylas formicarius]|uniref:GPI transamidase component PIG-T n=1 Tax=Cylas formicarius TaxID=197179 RepID=UPI002958BA29|nr:GPI transamidase component PIG-T [Cylas formicarius]
MNLHLCLFLVILKLLGATSLETFTEELLIKPLYSEQLYVHFQFVTKWDINSETENYLHSRLFPRALGEIINRHNIEELHVSLTGGLWRYETWGYPVVDAAPGAEVWAWFKSDTEDVNLNWKLLANSLSGLLCASFNFVDGSNTISPQFSFRPAGVRNNSSSNNTFLRYSSLPREVVCTENLTPFKKLLPCDSKLGLASLLNSGYIHNTRYHSLALHLRPVCQTEECDAITMELQLSVSLVYDYAILGTKNWSFKKLFGVGLNGKCPLAVESNIYIDLSSNCSQKFELIPRPNQIITSVRGGHASLFGRYNIEPYFFSIAALYDEQNGVAVISPPAVYANQHLTGYGQERGGIVTKIFNSYWGTLDVVLLQNIAWYVPVYLHTLKITSRGQEIEPKVVKYAPGRQREKPYYLEILLTVPPQSVTIVSIDFDYVFLKWQEYPPDANHGFYIGSAILSSYLPLARNYTGVPQDSCMISASFNASRSGYLVQVRTESMVITLPTPDFSMPYNVICLACTVVALAFGPLHNITTKRLVLKKKNEEKLIIRLKNKIVKLFSN